MKISYLPKRNVSYYLTEPFVFERKTEVIRSIPKNHSLLKTLKASICGSDLHYYLGQKAPEKLKQRLPVIPLHEGICLDISTGKRVVPLAGNFSNIPLEYLGKENIYPGLSYLGSTTDGLARRYLTYPKDLLVAVPDIVTDDLACLAEPLSIIFCSLRSMDPQYHHQIAIVGDGTMSYLLATVLSLYYKVSKKNLTVYGIRDAKLSKFKRLAQTVNIDTEDISSQTANIVFEAVGGPEMQKTLDLCLKLCAPGAEIGLIGISDNRPSLGISKVVNWGITIKGLTRSTHTDYEQSLVFMSDLQNQKFLQEFINVKQFEIRSASNLKSAFEYSATTRLPGRIVMKFI